MLPEEGLGIVGEGSGGAEGGGLEGDLQLYVDGGEIRGAGNELVQIAGGGGAALAAQCLGLKRGRGYVNGGAGDLGLRLG